jgi:cold-inducible RNA-binding protein
MKIYVGNLSFKTSTEDLEKLFSEAGTVTSANVIEDRETGRSRGFGFVEMASQEAGEAAIAQFNEKEVDGRSLKVNEAKPRESRSGFAGGRNGGNAFGQNRNSFGSNGARRDRTSFGSRDRTPRW